MSFSRQDNEFMISALEEAKNALNNGNYPIGALLVIDNKIAAKKINSLHSDSNWASHAELSIIKENSNLIRKKIKKNNSKVELYTTLEPCLMCLGASVLHRISRIIFSCPDPQGGATHINPKNLTAWYVRKWPIIEGGLLREKSYNLITKFMKMQNTDGWKNHLKLFEDMKRKWY